MRVLFASLAALALQCAQGQSVPEASDASVVELRDPDAVQAARRPPLGVDAPPMIALPR